MSDIPADGALNRGPGRRHAALDRRIGWSEAWSRIHHTSDNPLGPGQVDAQLGEHAAAGLVTGASAGGHRRPTRTVFVPAKFRYGPGVLGVVGVVVGDGC